ncbi:uncharacterized protein LOC132177862 isoform X2 [Corylus avellana]|uniref:uncharacterized protein LOC132177862 isoform X2 n=1 Tax=Corylus avellana TaxID=13451 RepID=UPI00286B18A4|nr:uncharacterized protein LOC132177862 isoform X2 [Corylus avellana]
MKLLQYLLSSTSNLLKQREHLIPYKSRRGLHRSTGGYPQQSGKDMNLSHFSVIPLPHSSKIHNRLIVETDYHAKRLLSGSQTITEVSHECPPETDLLSHINSIVDEPKGPYHCWLNTFGENNNSIKRGGTFLVLSGRFLDSLLNGSNSPCMLEKVKSLQQRSPQLHIMGFQCGSSVLSSVDQTRLVQRIMNEYITFPILLSSKTFPQVANACYILFKDSKSHVFYHEKDLDLEVLNKAVEELGAQLDESRLVHNLKSTWVKQAEIIKEPYLCSFLRNLLLYFPGCISADERGNRLFLSDSNHHRIIIFNSGGKILDCIGSSPGFEDGEFESAKLLRPAASFYNAVEDCLYFVDSENHAIRKADMGRRILETLYPTSNNDKMSNSLWIWIMNKLGLGKSVDTNSDEFDSKSLMFPWHLMKSEDGNFFVINRSFETLWIMDLASGKIKEVIKGFPNILETCQQWIMEKVSLLKQMPCDGLPLQIDTSCSLEGFPYAGLISSLSTFENHIVICDIVVMEFGEHRLIIFNVSACFQARGAATEVSGLEAIAGPSEKVGVAQQWYDELDNLAFTTPEPELIVEDNNTTKDNKFQDERVHINCAVNTSPGTSEVIICAVLHLKLRRTPDKGEDNQEKYAARIVDIMNQERTERVGRDSCIHFLLKSNRDLRDLIFIRPLHVRIKFSTPDHPKADSSKDIILTDDSIEVNVSLNS